MHRYLVLIIAKLRGVIYTMNIFQNFYIFLDDQTFIKRAVIPFESEKKIVKYSIYRGQVFSL